MTITSCWSFTFYSSIRLRFTNVNWHWCVLPFVHWLIVKVKAWIRIFNDEWVFHWYWSRWNKFNLSILILLISLLSSFLWCSPQSRLCIRKWLHSWMICFVAWRTVFTLFEKAFLSIWRINKTVLSTKGMDWLYSRTHLT
jgi:hypothetical protein